MKQRTGKWLIVLSTSFVLACSGVVFADETAADAPQTPAQAQEETQTRKFSLQEAIDTAIENNPQIGVRQLEIDSLEVSLKELEVHLLSY